MIATAIDTSVAVPALSAGHPEHLAAHAFVAAERPALPEHAAWETYAVLTRMPAPVGVSAAIAAQLITTNFADRLLRLPEGEMPTLLREIAAAGIVGGASYDALIALTTRAAGATLVSADQRARRTYAKLGVSVRAL